MIPLSWVPAAALAATALAAAPAAPLTATATPARAGAGPVSLVVTARLAELQCGRVVHGSVVVGLPQAMRVPTVIRPGSVRLQAAVPASVRVVGHTLVVQPAPPQGVICDSIGPGVVRVLFRPAAQLGNPTRRGSYRVWLRANAQTVSGRLTVS